MLGAASMRGVPALGLPKMTSTRCCDPDEYSSLRSSRLWHLHQLQVAISNNDSARIALVIIPPKLRSFLFRHLVRVGPSEFPSPRSY